MSKSFVRYPLVDRFANRIRVLCSRDDPCGRSHPDEYDWGSRNVQPSRQVQIGFDGVLEAVDVEGDAHVFAIDPDVRRQGGKDVDPTDVLAFGPERRENLTPKRDLPLAFTGELCGLVRLPRARRIAPWPDLDTRPLGEPLEGRPLFLVETCSSHPTARGIELERAEAEVYAGRVEGP